MLKIFLFFFLFLLPLHAEDLQRQRLAWQMEGGDVRNIAGLCRQYVQKKFEAQKTFSVEALLQDRDVARACYMAHFFSLVGKDRTYLLHELKDKEYVQWLLGHPVCGDIKYGNGDDPCQRLCLSGHHAPLPSRYRRRC